MQILIAIYKETVGMFIDDGALAFLSLILIILVAFAAKFAIIGGTLGAVLLIIGCVAILTESVSRAARTKARKQKV
jgi:predicted membrane protein